MRARGAWLAAAGFGLASPGLAAPGPVSGPADGTAGPDGIGPGMVEVATAEAGRPGGGAEEGTRPAAGSGGLVASLPAPLPPAAPAAGPALPPANGPGGSSPLPIPLPDASIAEGGEFAGDIVPAEATDEPAADPVADAPEASPAPQPEAMVTVSFVPRLKNAAMLGAGGEAKLTLDLPLSRLAEASGRLGAQTGEGSAAADTLWGGAGNDLLTGGDGTDVLFGGPGADTLDGGQGDDVLFLTGGSDLLRGGPGRDLFLIGLPGALQRGEARIVDFEPGLDALLAPNIPGAFAGYGQLSWNSRQMEILFSDRQPSSERLSVYLDYPPAEYWALSVETPRAKDLSIGASPSATIIADPRDPANARIIEPVEQNEAVGPAPPIATPTTSELDLL